MVVFYTFLGLVLIRLVALAVFLLLLLTAGPGCPACGRETIRIRSRALARLLTWLERRFCVHCGWAGLTRRGRPLARAAALESVPTTS